MMQKYSFILAKPYLIWVKNTLLFLFLIKKKNSIQFHIFPSNPIKQTRPKNLETKMFFIELTELNFPNMINS